MLRFILAAIFATIVVHPLAAQTGAIPPDTTWRLETVAGEDVTAEVTLQIAADGTVSGNASCNQYTGQNTAVLPEFALGPVAVTRMACPDMTTEAAYLAALALVTRAEMDDGRLVLSDADGSQMVFAPAE